MIKRRKALLLVTGIVMSMSLVGCDKKVAEQKSEIKGLKAQIEQKDSQIAQLKEDIGGLTITEQKHESSLSQIEGSLVPTFKTIDGMLKFPIKLDMPGGTESPNNSYLQVGTSYRFRPSNNWLARMKGTTVEMSHPSKVWGSLKAIQIPEPQPKENLEKMLKSFYKDFPGTTISYREVFIDGANGGLISKAPITVDDKPYVLNVGILQRGETAILLAFTYEDDESGVQQELIDLLLSSGTYLDYKITLE